MRMAYFPISIDRRIMENTLVSTTLPTESADRKAIPLATGVLDYFPAALAEVAKVSKAGNDKHNPGQPMHHARGKSTDHADSIMRHLTERGGIDVDTGVRHSAELAWRALALLQQELEDAGAPPARAARFPEEGNSRDVREATQPPTDWASRVESAAQRARRHPGEVTPTPHIKAALDQEFGS